MLTFIKEAVRLGMTLLFGSTGETITEKSGHLNLGIPGVMCVGASFGCIATYIYIQILGGNISSINFFEKLLLFVIPIIASLIGGAVIGLLYSFLTVTLRANQNVTGLVITTFGVGVSNVMISKIRGFSQASKYFTSPVFPFAKKLGWFGEVFLSYGILVYLAIIVAIVASYVLTRTRVGLHLRAVGENPATADAAGINVTAYRYISTCIGSSVAALGGFTFIMDNLNGNWEYSIDAMGWLSVALVIFTVWKPNVGIFASIIFGGLYIASSYIHGIPFALKEVFKMLPYVVTVIVLIITSMRKKKEYQPPAGLGVNYFREER